MTLNNLSRSAWAKLSKTFWSTQRAIQHLEIQPLTLESFYLGKIKSLTLSEVDESQVKLIELLTRENQIIIGDEITRAAALTVNRKFFTLDEEKINADLLIKEISNRQQIFSSNQFIEYFDKLKNQAYAAFIVSDYRDKSGYYLLHAEVAEGLKKAGFTMQGLMVLVKEQHLLKPYGYPKTFVPNIINKFVLIMRK